MRWFFTTIYQKRTSLFGSLFYSWTAFSDQSIQEVAVRARVSQYGIRMLRAFLMRAPI